MNKVLVTDYTWPSTDAEAEVLASVGAELVIAETGSETELVELVRDVDAILTCFAKVTASVIRAGERLQVIGRYGIGVDNIDVGEATARGIPVTNVPAYCLDEVAEHTLALLLSLARKVVIFNAAVREGDWSLHTGQSSQPIFRVRGRSIGIVGFGKIGRRVGEAATALGLRVLAYDPALSAKDIGRFGVEAAALDAIARQADFVTVHVPLTPATTGMIDATFLGAMKPTAFVINTARGGIVDQDALAQALRDGSIAGAGLDVFDPERIPPDHPLMSAPNLIMTPHVAFYSEESVLELERLAAENVAAVLSGHRPPHIVNPEVLDLERWATLAS